MCSVDIEAILHPEHLPPSVLLKMLQERRIKLDGLEVMNAEQLLHIYKQFCLPQPQRMYRDTVRGKILSRQQQERERNTSRSPQKKSAASNGLGEVRWKPYDVENRDKRKLTQNGSTEMNSPPPNKKQRTKITWP